MRQPGSAVSRANCAFSRRNRNQGACGSDVEKQRKTGGVVILSAK